jgi:hypothetical protein
MTSPRQPKLRTLLVLGRISNLPTVWSDCLAGWWLATGGPVGSVGRLLCVSICVSLLYVGGMYLNDAFDAGFDRHQRASRPIPSGLISEWEVWAWGFGWLMLGLVGLVFMGKTTALYAVLLTLCILVYNAIHKFVVLAPALMGTCRFLVYLTAASVGLSGIPGEVVWKGLALAGYIVGLSCLARKESAPVQIQYWPAIFLLAPVCVAGLFDDGSDILAALVCSVVVTIWAGWSLVQTYGLEHPNVGRAVSRLLAGIALVDLLAVADFSHFATGIFVLCFLLAVALQRYVPAT